MKQFIGWIITVLSVISLAYASQIAGDGLWLSLTVSALTVLLIWGLYLTNVPQFLFINCARRFTKKHADSLTAEKCSIKNHSLATCLNAGGLGLGIILVFYGGSFSEQLMHAGVAIVFMSIICYLGIEWVACNDDLQLADRSSADNLGYRADLLNAVKSIATDIAANHTVLITALQSNHAELLTALTNISSQVAAEHALLTIAVNENHAELVTAVKDINRGDLIVQARMPEKLELGDNCMRFVYSEQTRISSQGA